MEVRRWSRAELCELARDRAVCLRTTSAAVLPLPDWLVASAVSVIETDSAESIATLYPADRPVALDLFNQAIHRPGEPCTAGVRAKVDGGWQHMEMTWLNLVDQVDVGGMVCLVRAVEGPPIVAPVERDCGDHSATNWMVLTIGETAEILAVEGRVEEMLGYRPEEVIGRRPTDFLPVESVSDSVHLWVELRARPGNVNTSRRPWLRRDGTQIWLEASYLNRADTGPAPVMAVVWDITERMVQEQALRQREAEVRALAEEFRLLAEEVPSAVFRCAVDGTVEFHNARWTELLQGGEGVTRLHDIVSADSRPALDATLRELAAAPRAHLRSVELDGIDGTSVWRLSLRSMGDTGGRHRTFVGSLSEVSATVRLRREAREDPLTGLLNRQGLEERLAAALAEEPTGTLVLFVDLDGFKVVNDTHGHDAGDVVLTDVAHRLQLGIRPDDVVARYGGDEFVVVCTRAQATDAGVIRERLELALGGPIEFEGGSWQPRASIGVARPEAGDDPASLVRRADQAMFAVKRVRSSSREGAGPTR